MKLNSPTILVAVIAIIAIAEASHSWRGVQASDVYGKPCTNGTVPEGAKLVNCGNMNLMVCTEAGRCECAPSPGDSKATKYDPEDRRCVSIPSQENEFRCQTDFQCQHSSYGTYSRCNLDNGRCQCWNDDLPMNLKGDICYVVTPEKERRMMPSCVYNSDCTRTAGLGELSRCNQVTVTCECYDTVSNNKNKVAYYNGKCIYHRLLGDLCESDDECRAGNTHANARCLPHPTYLQGEKTCQCPGNNPNRCDGSNGGTGVAIVALSTLLLGVVANHVVV